jgi:DnaK suppressor protein
MKISNKKSKKKIQKKAAPQKKIKAKAKPKTKTTAKKAAIKSKTKVRKTIKPSKTTKKVAKKTVKKPIKKKPTKKPVKKPVKKIVKKPIKKTIKKSVKKLIKKPAKKPISVKKLTKKPIAQKRSSTKASFGPIEIQPYFPKRNENHMNEKQLAHFRSILLQWKEHLMKDVDRTMHHMQDEASNYPDPVDRASQEEEFSLELRTRDRERKLLKKIEETLLRINDRDYGYCDDCGTEIGLRRLEARPTATQCIECKTIAELREKQLGESN